jgi:hypothetical protein
MNPLAIIRKIRLFFPSSTFFESPPSLFIMNPLLRKLLCSLLGVMASLCLFGTALRAQTQVHPQEPVTGDKPSDKCEVCHNGTNPHTVIVPCHKVNNYLSTHPGDYAGPCQGVSPEKPPKPTPTP